MATNSWPKIVPVLNRRRICKHMYHQGDSKDISAWGWSAFPNVSNKFRTALELYLKNEYGWDKGINAWNDQATKVDIARAFNTVAAAFGYNKNNPCNLAGYNLRRQIRAAKKTKLLPRRVAQNV